MSEVYQETETATTDINSIHLRPQQIESVRVELHNVTERVNMLKLQVSAIEDAIWAGVLTEINDETEKLRYTNDTQRDIERRRRGRENTVYGRLYVEMLQAERDKAILTAHVERLRMEFEIVFFDYRRSEYPVVTALAGGNVK